MQSGITHGGFGLSVSDRSEENKRLMVKHPRIQGKLTSGREA
jgi:hypothetical protein